MLTLAEHLNLNVVAEGVETPEQLRLLRKLHCKYIQGYILSKPLPADQMTAFLQKPFVDQHLIELATSV